MTSRQPGREPPPGLSSAGWAVRVIPLALLLILTLAGLRGSIAKPRWNGPMHASAVGVGLALIVVLTTLLVITWLRRRRALARPHDDAEDGVAVRLGGVLLAVLSLGIATITVVLIYAAHLNLNGKQQPRGQVTPPPTRPRSAHPTHTRPEVLSIPAGGILYVLLVLALVSAVLVSIWWSRRLRPSFGRTHEPEQREDSQDLREAVESGRFAMRTLDDARAAIIACYVAMERSLADRGTARGAADTPDELLARATSENIVHGTAPARLTALFYEARFSSHPMDQTQRRAAEQALDELADALAARPAPAEAAT